MRLQRDFFERPTLQVAADLLGKTLVFEGYKGIVTETEAYIGQDDPACHAAKGLTPRTEVMFGPAGYSYIYFIYGMYHCLNFVTEGEGFPAAVLIRGLRLTEPQSLLLDGPGKLCRQLNLTKDQNRIDVIKSDNFYLLDTPSIKPYQTTPRIGIKQGQDKLWRFLAE